MMSTVFHFARLMKGLEQLRRDNQAKQTGKNEVNRRLEAAPKPKLQSTA
jgi:hypothetical protein